MISLLHELCETLPQRYVSCTWLPSSLEAANFYVSHVHRGLHVLFYFLESPPVETEPALTLTCHFDSQVCFNEFSSISTICCGYFPSLDKGTIKVLM